MTRKRSARGWSIASLSMVCVLLLTGCVAGEAPANTAPSDPRAAGGLRYGLAPEPDKGTTFEPDVVLVYGGASSVRSVTADGMTWTISPTARGASDLKPGRVMFLTDRAVGRVLDVQHEAAGLAVTIGPVSLTDVIRDGHYAGTVPLTDPIAIPATNAMWNDETVKQEAGVTGQDDPVPTAPDPAPAVFTKVTPPNRSAAQDAVLSGIIRADQGNFKAAESFDSHGFVLKASYPGKDLEASASVAVEMHSPKAHFDLDLGADKIKLARLTVDGALDLVAKVHALTAPHSPTNGYSPEIGDGATFSFPINAVFGVPLNVMVQQRFKVAFHIPGQAVFNGGGKIKLGATLGGKYQDGKFYNLTTGTYDGVGSLDFTNSIAVGISSASVWYDIRFTVGIGAFGFIAGVFVDIGVNIYASVGAPIGINELPGASSPIEACKRVFGALLHDEGVGYRIPEPVAAVVNWFLKFVHVKPIKSSDGYSVGWQWIGKPRNFVWPDSGFCVKK